MPGLVNGRMAVDWRVVAIFPFAVRAPERP